MYFNIFRISLCSTYILLSLVFSSAKNCFFRESAMLKNILNGIKEQIAKSLRKAPVWRNYSQNCLPFWYRAFSPLLLKREECCSIECGEGGYLISLPLVSARVSESSECESQVNLKNFHKLQWLYLCSIFCIFTCRCSYCLYDQYDWWVLTYICINCFQITNNHLICFYLILNHQFTHYKVFLI